MGPIIILQVAFMSLIAGARLTGYDIECDFDDEEARGWLAQIAAGTHILSYSIVDDVVVPALEVRRA